MKSSSLLKRLKEPPIATALVTAVAIIAVAIVITFSSLLSDGPSALQRIASLEAAATNQVGLQATISFYQTRMAVTPQVVGNSDVQNQLSSMDNRINQIGTQVANLNDTIIQDPDKAVAIPILRADLENQQSLNDRRFTAVEDSVSRVYGLIVGVLVVIGLGFLGIAATNLLTKRKDEKAD